MTISTVKTSHPLDIHSYEIHESLDGEVEQKLCRTNAMSNFNWPPGECLTPTIGDTDMDKAVPIEDLDDLLTLIGRKV